MALILAIRGLLNGSDAATAYLVVAVVTAPDPDPHSIGARARVGWTCTGEQPAA